MSVKLNADSDQIILGAKGGYLAVFDMNIEKITDLIQAHSEDLNTI